MADEDFVPKHQVLLREKKLRHRVEELEELLRSCTVCPKLCGNDRLNDEIAACYSGRLPIVSSYTAHFGEEPCLSGTHGAGNIFFGNCNLRCVYCQNYQISQTWKEQKKNEVTHERLAEMMLELEARGCHNLGFVSPTHFAPQMARAILIAAERGFSLPIVYNTNAYDSVEVLRTARRHRRCLSAGSKICGRSGRASVFKDPRLPHARSRAIKEMHRQMGSGLVFGDDGLLRRGLLIRLLVLPNDIAGLEENLRWIRDELGPRTAISLMAQYYATNKAATDRATSFSPAASAKANGSRPSRFSTNSEWKRALCRNTKAPRTITGRILMIRTSRSRTSGTFGKGQALWEREPQMDTD
jgi:putative pyruvate formate lyase activating enzyme